MPRRIMTYQQIITKGKALEQVLIEGEGLPLKDKSLEDINAIAQLAPSANIEDKVRLVDGGDVTVGLDLKVVKG